MIISINTDTINQMAAAVNSANQELENCAAVLSTVMEHNDWNCLERDAINESIRTLKAKAAKLEEDMGRFAGAMRQAAQDFNDLEQSLPAQFQHMDTVLAQLNGIPSGGTAGVNSVTAGVAQTAAAEVTTVSRLESYSVGSLSEDIQVCRFADFQNQG